MSTSLNQSQQPFPALRAGIVDRVAEYLERSGDPRASLLCDFAREFYAKAPRQLLTERTVEDLATLTRAAFELLEKGMGDSVMVEVVDPSDEGWSAPVTVIRAELRDRPFVVDTIREYLNSRDLPIIHYVYPVVGVERSPDGEIVRILPPAPANARAIVHCEIPTLAEPEQRSHLRQAIEDRLLDVVAATDDFEEMLDAVDRTVQVLDRYRQTNGGRNSELREVQDLLRWLKQENFVFLGYREYETVIDDGVVKLRVTPGSGRGILRKEDRSMWGPGVPLAEVPEELRSRVVEGPLLITSKTNSESTVHRRSRMDYIGVKQLADSGEITGEFRFLGLFTSKAYAESAERIPILRRKLEAILAHSGALPGSHDYKEIITIFNSMPKEDLFQASSEELDAEIQAALSLLFSDEVQVTLRPDALQRGVRVSVMLPRGKYSGKARQLIQEVLIRRFSGSILNYHLAMSTGDQARMHFYVSSPREVAVAVSAEELADQIRQIIRSWEDVLADELTARVGPTEGEQLATLYGTAFSEEYRAATLPEVAIDDVRELERLRQSGGSVSVALTKPRGRGRAEEFRGITALKLYLVGSRIVLSDFMPLLDNAGLRVVEVTPFVVASRSLPEMMIYSFAVQSMNGEVVPEEAAGILAEALLAIREGQTANDPFNALVVRAGLRWREVDVIRTYGYFAFQAGLIPTRFASARALARHPELAVMLVELFRLRHEPPAGEDQPPLRREAELTELRTRFTAALDDVSTLADDRAIRRLFTLVEATTRTNYYLAGGADPKRKSGGAPYISVKIRVADVEELRRSGLLYEVYVLSANMEGIHLRAAAVSRGGIRWSDRPDDFRAEVLGLVQTQMVKNAVIVPAGSKGGFVTKRVLPSREQMGVEVAEQYRTLIRGLLDVTDNIVDGRVVPPGGMVRWDGDDPYLVVAADKGTAHLSDVANGVSQEYGFWLGDAFASGGSQGYDHKKEGITARGAWETVKRHFRELGKDIQSEPFTVVGIGDMSGDVFGNGMLLSRQIRLIAAFDHRNVFIDPSPDPESSYQERERLFVMARSSWEDYDRTILSPGAMIVPRAAKQVELTPEARQALGLEESVSTLDGESLVRAVLRAPVELLWNGGIGTYVKDAEETNAEVGDSSNDSVRIDADELRCRVIGEGGNLGMTQRARITFALGGGRLNTDALDNSGGVDLSDHEVNLKVLLEPRVRSGAMSLDERNDLLTEIKSEVTQLVLSNNVTQSLAVSLDEARSKQALGDFTGLVLSFERERLMDRRTAGIPSMDELEDRGDSGLGLTRPTLCVLLAYSKLHAKRHLLESGLPDDSTTEHYLAGYFPDAAVERAGLDVLRAHPLRREIVATQIVNSMVDVMGATFLYRVMRDTGRPAERVISSWFIADTISGAGEIRARLERLEGRYPAEVVYRWHAGLARVLERTTRWTLANVDPDAPTERMIDELRGGLSTLRGDFRQLVMGEDRDVFLQRVEELREIGVEGQLAEEMITLRFLPELLDILRIAHMGDDDPVATAQTYYRVAEEFVVTWVQYALRGLSRFDPWEKRLIETLDGDIHRAHRGITRNIMALAEGNGGSMNGAIGSFRNQRSEEWRHYRELVDELREAETIPLSAFAVAIRALLVLAEG